MTLLSICPRFRDPIDCARLMKGFVSTSRGFSDYPIRVPSSPNQSLFELGLDSLMAMELRRRLADIAGAMLPAALVFNYPNLSALVKSTR